MKLYSNKQSPSCKRAIAAAHELGLKLDVVELEFSKGDMQKPEYLAKNPMGKVPTFEDDDGWMLWESAAIVAYLASKNPQANLVPSDPRARAEVARWTLWNASHFEAAVFRVAFEKLVKPFMGQTPDEAKIAEGKEWFARFAPVLNANLEGKTWMTGNAFSAADINLGTTVELAAACGLEFTPYRHITAWLSRLQARDCWKKASS